MKKIAIATDHAAFPMKEYIKQWLVEQGYHVEDFGTYSDDSVSYVDMVYPAAKSVAKGKNDLGIVMCGTGLGANYVANKVPGIRAALCQEEYSTKLSRLHNDANVLVLGGRILAPVRALELVKIWLETPFEGGRHQERIDQISKIDK